jgi:LAGLIDADG endonuclease
MLIDKEALYAEAKVGESIINEKERPLDSKTRLGYSINISLSQIDLNLLEDIKKILNDIGTIYVYPKRNEARLAIWKKDEVRLLVENVFDIYPLMTDHQKDRYAKLRYGFLNNITLFHNLQELEEFKNKKNLFLTSLSLPSSASLQTQYLDNWILGIINSEGCFYTRPKKDGSNLLVFQIEHTDKKVLDIIKSRFKFRPTIFERAERSINQKKLIPYTFLLNWTLLL